MWNFYVLMTHTVCSEGLSKNVYTIGFCMNCGPRTFLILAICNYYLFNFSMYICTGQSSQDFSWFCDWSQWWTHQQHSKHLRSQTAVPKWWVKLYCHNKFDPPFFVSSGPKFFSKYLTPKVRIRVEAKLELRFE